MFHSCLISLNEQVRGESDTGTYGDWGAVENFTLPSVPSPQNITFDVFSVKRENVLQISLEVTLEWKAPEDLKESSIKPEVARERRQTELNTESDNGITAYEVLISADRSMITDYAPTPTGPGYVSRRFRVRIHAHIQCHAVKCNTISKSCLICSCM